MGEGLHLSIKCDRAFTFLLMSLDLMLCVETYLWYKYLHCPSSCSLGCPLDCLQGIFTEPAPVVLHGVVLSSMYWSCTFCTVMISSSVLSFTSTLPLIGFFDQPLPLSTNDTDNAGVCPSMIFPDPAPPPPGVPASRGIHYVCHRLKPSSWSTH